MGRLSKIIPQFKVNKSALRFFVLSIVLLIIVTLFLIYATSLAQGFINTNKVDMEKAIGFRYKHENIPFESGQFISSLSGEKSILLNVTLNGSEQHLYTDTLEKIQNVGLLSIDGNTQLLIFNSEVNEGQEYIINAEAITFFNYGTKDEVLVFYVQEYHELGLLDELIANNRMLFNQLGLILFMLAVVFGLTLGGVVLWFIGSLDKIFVEIKKDDKKLS